ncbi:MAG TPA: hypothetical protein VHU40_22275 [Polyangia bacterium]|nr:hypothetical protein [Polyangia bacterium]
MAAALTCLARPASATPTAAIDVTATVTAIAPVPAPPTVIRTWRVTFHVEDRPGGHADALPPELTFAFRSPALRILGLGRRYSLSLSKHGNEYVVDHDRIREERTATTPRDVQPMNPHYRVMRILTRRPYLTWLAESSGAMNLFMSTTGDDPRNPRRDVDIDDAETGILQRLPATDVEITFDKVAGLGDEYVLVKLNTRSADAPARLVERMQYLVHRPRQRGRMGDVACQFPGDASIQVTHRVPLAFHVTPQATGKPTPAAGLDYEMVPPEVIPSSSSCTIHHPRDDPSASDFEYEATLALANMLSGKGHFSGAGEARQRAFHMRPNVEDAEDVALLSITELNSFHDGGCSFAPTGPSPLPIPKRLVPVLRAYDDYVTRFPQGAYVPHFIERKAAYLAQCQHHREAAELYGTLIARYPNHPLSEDAARWRAEELARAPQ